MLKDIDYWVKNVSTIQYHGSYKTFKEAIRDQISAAIDSSDHPKVESVSDMEKILDNLPPSYSHEYMADTSPGGNDAMNPYWSFCQDDDIVHPIHSIDGEKRDAYDPHGLGRVYGEVYENNQQILWLSMGVPQYAGMYDFFVGSADAHTAKLMNTGSLSIVGKMLRLITNTGRLAFHIVTVPTWILGRLYDLATSGSTVNRYYDFKPTMTLYYRMCNTILSHLAVNMGLLPNTRMAPGKQSGYFESAPVVGKLVEGLHHRISEYLPEDDTPVYEAKSAGIPTILKHGPDIFAIINKRAEWRNLQVPTTDDLVEELQNKRTTNSAGTLTRIIHNNIAGEGAPALSEASDEAATDGGLFDTAGNEFTEHISLPNEISKHMFGGTDFIGFRIEKDSNASEGITNSTSESSIASKLASMTNTAKETRFTLSGGKTGFGIVDDAIGILGDAVNTVTGWTGTGGAAAVKLGIGHFHLPEVWSDSSFSKSYQFDVNLRARYGDPISIYQSIYIPLAMLLAASLPRAIGKNMYTSPFLIRAYSKGMFSVPVGMIDSLSITRGLSEFGWNATHLPTAVSVNVSIKDLSPAFFLSLISDGIIQGFFDIFSRNENMHDYLMILAGSDIREQIEIMPQIARRYHAWLNIIQKTTMSKTYWGGMIGRNPVLRNIMSWAPYRSDIPTQARQSALR